MHVVYHFSNGSTVREDQSHLKASEEEVLVGLVEVMTSGGAGVPRVITVADMDQGGRPSLVFTDHIIRMELVEGAAEVPLKEGIAAMKEKLKGRRRVA